MNYLDASIEVSERGPLTLGPFPPKGAREVVPKHAIVVYHLSGEGGAKAPKGVFLPRSKLRGILSIKVNGFEHNFCERGEITENTCHFREMGDSHKPGKTLDIP